jgi:hypothetical protein
LTKHNCVVAHRLHPAERVASVNGTSEKLALHIQQHRRAPSSHSPAQDVKLSTLFIHAQSPRFSRQAARILRARCCSPCLARNASFGIDDDANGTPSSLVSYDMVDIQPQGRFEIQATSGIFRARVQHHLNLETCVFDGNVVLPCSGMQSSCTNLES